MRYRNAGNGLSLVEILIAVTLMGLLVLMFSTLLLRGIGMSYSMDTRYNEAVQVHNLILDIQRDLYRGVYISNNSHQKRLEYTTYDDSGFALKKVYGICYSTLSAASTDTGCAKSSGSNTIPYLKLSLDSGLTWGSPYRIGSYSKYYLKGSPAFLYAQEENNCTQFTDTDGNGVWASGVDSAGSYTTCGNYSTGSTLLGNPSEASKVILSSFQFSSLTGNPLVSRNLPATLFINAPQGLLVSSMAAVSPGVKDSPLLQSFVTNTANSRFGTAFDIRGVAWDASRQRMIVVGHQTSGSAKVFQVDRTGVLIGLPLPILDANVQLNDVSMLDDNQSIIALDDVSKKVYWYTLSSAVPLSPYQVFNIGNPSLGTPSLSSTSNLVNSPTAILYDPLYPGEFFVTGIDPADSTMKIFEISATTGALATNALSGGKLALPSAFDASHPVGSLSQEPSSGDFLVTRNYVNVSGSVKTIDIYRISSSGTSSSFSINTGDIGSTASGTNGNWGLAYNPETNHLFLTDSATNLLYEILPPLLISPRS